ncbi:MAG: ATP phosphoribosyltransferase regulatory subunit [Christensenella sp.]|uniref:ATP phosphoribosyltransferase regulatory subunit n=1 Tax=Christensenella sp. TaxID=1935934 RepID=UPI002B21D115|nr:ATP phosphoribosyltransferase regulatory subunit [Christensenella sp.]MEA5004766.1 ATP phosphoribosyltransferase regulatory subunit [Christensenella sp.]
MNKLKLQVPSGAWDYLPQECAAKRKAENTVRNEFLKSGYHEIETPSFEHYEVFMHDAVPYVQENMIKFFDLRGRILALRPDSTGPIARLAATKLLSQDDVLRLCYVQNAYGFFNHGIAGKTEFTQAGVELIGKSGADADAEVIALAIRALKAAGVDDFQIDIGQVAYFKGLIKSASLDEEQTEKIRLLIDTKNSVELEYELSRFNIPADLKSALLELVSLFGGAEVLDKAKSLARNEACMQAVDNMKEVYQILCDFGYEQYISIDFGILNNFNYYSGILFRGISGAIGTPILSGGRYDDLLNEFGANTPATGFAMGIKEVLLVLEQAGMLTQDEERVTVVRCSEKSRKEAYAFVQELRVQGKCAVLELNTSSYDAQKYTVIEFDER